MYVSICFCSWHTVCIPGPAEPGPRLVLPGVFSLRILQNAWPRPMPSCSILRAPYKGRLRDLSDREIYSPGSNLDCAVWNQGFRVCNSTPAELQTIKPGSRSTKSMFRPGFAYFIVGYLAQAVSIEPNHWPSGPLALCSGRLRADFGPQPTRNMF